MVMVDVVVMDVVVMDVVVIVDVVVIQKLRYQHHVVVLPLQQL